MLSSLAPNIYFLFFSYGIVVGKDPGPPTPTPRVAKLRVHISSLMSYIIKLI